MMHLLELRARVRGAARDEGLNAVAAQVHALEVPERAVVPVHEVVVEVFPRPGEVWLSTRKCHIDTI